MDKYIIKTSEDIIKCLLNKNVKVKLEPYRKFLTDKRVKSIKKYKEYELISPDIYNLCYLILTKEYNMDKKTVINSMEEDVNRYKKEMREIYILNYNPEEYFKSKQEKEIVVKRHPSKGKGINWDVDEFERSDFNPWRI